MTELKEAIELLEKAEPFIRMAKKSYEALRALEQTPTGNEQMLFEICCKVDQALAILKEQPEPKCKTCGDTKQTPTPQSAGFGIQNAIMQECPDCKEQPPHPCNYVNFDRVAQEQPPAGDFRETCAKFLREFEIVDAAKNLYGVRDILQEACTIIDSQSAQLKAKDELLFAYESVRAPKQPPASEFTKRARLAAHDNLPTMRMTMSSLANLILEACDRLDRSEASRKDYECRLKAHIAGEAVKGFCQDCRKPFWNVDDEDMTCPFCGWKGFPVPDIDAEQIA